MDAILKAKSLRQTSSGCPIAASPRTKLAERISFGYARAAGSGGLASSTRGGLTSAARGRFAPAARGRFAPAARGGLAPAARGGLAPAARGGLAPAVRSGLAPAARGGLAPAARGGLAPVARGELAPAARGGLTPTTRGDLVPAARRGRHGQVYRRGAFVPAVRPKGGIGAERVAEKCNPVAAAAAVAPGYSEAAAELCVNKHCLLNICEVPHKGYALTQALHSPAGSSRNFQAAAKEVHSGHKDSQLWRSSEAAMKKNVQQSVAESTAKTYSYWWNRFCLFCCRTGATRMPFSGHTAAVFLSSLAEAAAGLGGVDTARSALRHYFTVNCPDIKCPTDGTEVTLVMKGIRRRFAKPVSKKSPLTGEQFYKILDKLLDKSTSPLSNCVG